jgi:hypothetical protein
LSSTTYRKSGKSAANSAIGDKQQKARALVMTSMVGQAREQGHIENCHVDDKSRGVSRRSPMDWRTFVSMVVAGAAGPLLARLPAAPRSSKKQNGSDWYHVNSRETE